MNVTYLSNNDTGVLTKYTNGWYNIRFNDKTFVNTRKKNISASTSDIITFIKYIPERIYCQNAYDVCMNIFKYIAINLKKKIKLNTFKRNIKNIFESSISQDLILSYTFLINHNVHLFLHKLNEHIIEYSKYLSDHIFREYFIMDNTFIRQNSYNCGAIFTRIVTRRLLRLDRDTCNDILDEIKHIFTMVDGFIQKNGYISNKDMLFVIDKLKNINVNDRKRLFTFLYDELYHLASCSPMYYTNICKSYIQKIDNIQRGFLSYNNSILFNPDEHDSMCHVCFEEFKNGSYICLVHPSTSDKHILCSYCINGVSKCPFCRCPLEI